MILENYFPKAIKSVCISTLVEETARLKCDHLYGLDCAHREARALYSLTQRDPVSRDDIAGGLIATQIGRVLHCYFDVQITIFTVVLFDEETLVALALEQERLAVLDEPAHAQLLRALDVLGAFAIARFARVLDQGTEALARVTPLLLAEQRILTDALTLARVAGGALAAVLLTRAVARWAQLAPEVTNACLDFVTVCGRKQHVDETQLQLYFDVIRVEVQAFLTVFALAIRCGTGISLRIVVFSLVLALLASSLEHLEETVVREIKVLHEALLAALSLPSLDLLLVYFGLVMLDV